MQKNWVARITLKSKEHEDIPQEHVMYFNDCYITYVGSIVSRKIFELDARYEIIAVEIYEQN